MMTTKVVAATIGVARKRVDLAKREGEPPSLPLPTASFPPWSLTGPNCVRENRSETKDSRERKKERLSTLGGTAEAAGT